MQVSNLKSQFKASGYLHLKDYWDDGDLTEFESAIFELFLMQARKIGDYDDRPFYSIDDIVTALEEKDKSALYAVQKMLQKSQWVRLLFGVPFLNMCAEILGSRSDHILIDGPALFVKLPNNKRLLYRFHSEANYYSKRRTFVNCWFPVFNDRRTDEDGAMVILPESHKRAWTTSDFIEYTGYDSDTQDKAQHFWQAEIPENFLTDYKRHVCDCDRGDLIVFDRNLVHTSMPNLTDRPSYAIVLRVWDPSNDLTLSGEMEAQAYSGNLGRYNLKVDP